MDDAPARSWRPAIVLASVASVGAALVGCWVIRPWQAVLIGYDTTSTVVYFERIVAGERLERFLGTTPKPLLTLVDGSLHAITGDWRPIAWLALLIYALAIGAAVMLATRLSGPAAGGFAAAVLMTSRGLLVDLSQAYAVAWALLALCVAGLALARSSPRSLVAGSALAVAGLARQEALLVSGVAAVAVVGVFLVRRDTRPPGAALWLLLGLLAVPITGLHDLLLTGDVLYTLKVPAIGAIGHDVGGVSAAMAAVTNHTIANIPLVALAVVGVVGLARAHAWPALLGLGTIGIGVAVLVIVVGARGMIVLDRYAFPIELALWLLAASGIGWIAARVLGRIPAPGGRSTAMIVVAILGSASIGLVVQPRIGPLDVSTIARIETERRAARDYAALLPSLRAAVESVPALREPPDRRDPYTRETSGPTLLVSPRLLPQVVVDLDVRLDRVVTVVGVDPESDRLAVGSLVLHFARLDGKGVAAWAEVELPTGSLVPIDRVGRRAWLIRVEPSP